MKNNDILTVNDIQMLFDCDFRNAVMLIQGIKALIASKRCECSRSGKRTVKELRIKNGLQSKEIADLLNLSASGYADKENGKRKFTPQEIYFLCKLFEVDILDLNLDSLKNSNKNLNKGDTAHDPA